MPTLSQLRKQANATPKYVLELEEVEGFYLNASGDNVTQDTKEALQYSVGFDNEKMKIQYWSAAINAPLKVKYL